MNGESLEIEVTYHPVPGLEASGRLVIEADIPIFGGEIELQGSDRSASLPAIHLSSNFNTLVPFYNNFGGAVVGEATGFTGPGGSSRNPLITNNGTAPLVISEIRVAEGQGAGEWTTTSGDPVALLRILDTFVDTPEDVLRSFDFPIGVICGDADTDNGSAAALAELVPRGQLITVPGNHMSAVIKAELGLAIRDFLLEGGI